MAQLIEVIDRLVLQLESALDAVADYEFVAVAGRPPRRGTFRIVSSAYVSLADRKPRSVDVLLMRGAEMMFQSRDNVARRATLEVTVLTKKTGEGEVLHVVQATVTDVKRSMGGYEVYCALTGLQRMAVPAYRRFLDCVTNEDPVGWSRWCADLREPAVLRDLDLQRTDLTRFDLCCADLAGSDLSDANLSGALLSGANLSGCCLDGAQVAGADLFGARIPSDYRGLVANSGMIEVESVIFLEDGDT